MDTADDRLMLPTEVAHLLGVDRRTLYRWAKAGLIPTVPTAGGYRRYRASDVEAFRDSQQLRPRDELLTAQQVCDMFNLSYHVFRHMHRTGRVPFVKTPGGQRRFRLEDVQAALSAR